MEKFKKGQKILTREGKIETVLRINSNGNIETAENDYSHPASSVEKYTPYTEKNYTIFLGKTPVGIVLVNWKGENEIAILQGMPRLRTIEKIIRDLPEFSKINNINDCTWPKLVTKNYLKQH